MLWCIKVFIQRLSQIKQSDWLTAGVYIAYTPADIHLLIYTCWLSASASETRLIALDRKLRFSHFHFPEQGAGTGFRSSPSAGVRAVRDHRKWSKTGYPKTPMEISMQFYFSDFGRLPLSNGRSERLSDARIRFLVEF